MSQKILQISPEDAKYIDPNQIASLTMIDGSTIYVRDSQQCGEEGFVEENQDMVEQQASTQQVQTQQQPLRGVGTNLALGLAAATAATLGAAALGKAVGATRPIGRPMVGGMARPVMMGPPMAPPMRGPMMAPVRPMGPRMMRPRY